jgi:vanadium chloroperoxidase
VAWVILDLLAVKPGQIGADEGAYQPRDGRFYFRDEPGNPVRLAPLDPNHPERGLAARRVYHGPFYGMTVPDFAVTDPEGHRIAEWPRTTEYRNALREVYKLGGAPDLATTTRSPDQTVAAYYWAYDGANLIGTPPRLYNQILRVVAWDKRIAGATPLEEASDFVRLFALANVAMSDAGKYAWKEKYRYELWRPLTGIREHDTASGPAPTTGNDQLENDADPFWRTLGAPNTNTNRDSFKPPFPAYPSGHATFGAAAFQMARLFYADRDGVTLNANRADDIEFSFVSEELNGINRDLVESYDRSRPIQDQPGLVRTRVVRSFPSLWHAIFENGLSRVFLGVHWRFDAFDARDALRPNGSYKDPGTISYRNVWTAPRPATVANNALPIGGIPLGLGIANDIFGNQMKAPASAASAMSTAMLISAPQAKASNTTYA